MGEEEAEIQHVDDALDVCLGMTGSEPSGEEDTSPAGSPCSAGPLPPFWSSFIPLRAKKELRESSDIEGVQRERSLEKE